MQNFQEEEMTIDLLDVWHTLTKNAPLIRNVTIGVTALALAYVFIVPPTYEAQALIRIKQEKGISSSLLDAMPMGNVQANQQLLNTYQEILKSRSVVEPAIKAAVKPNKEGKYPAYEGYVNGNITTIPFKNTDMVQVSVRGKSPEEAKKANDALLASFLNRLTEIERTKYSITRKFLEDRLEGAKKDLHASEDILNKFQKEHKIIAPDDVVKLTAEKFSMTGKLKAQNQIDKEAGNAMAASVSSVLQNNAASIADSDMVKAYNAQLSKLEAQRIEMATKYTQKHPAMIKINQDIAEMQAKLDEAVNAVANGRNASSNPVYNSLLADKLKAQAQANVAASNLATIEAIETKYGEDLETLSDNQKEYVRLLRDVTVAQEIYSMLAKRLEEAKVAEVSVTRDVQIIDNAALPDFPVAPIKRRTVMFAFLFGLLSSSAYVVIRSLMNRTVKTSEDIEKYLGLPVLGQIPSVESLNEAKEVAELNTMKKIWRALWKK